jgi:hypothetical protein
METITDNKTKWITGFGDRERMYIDDEDELKYEKYLMFLKENDLAYSSHLEALQLAVDKTLDLIIEFGAGLHSTKFLSETKRPFLSFETSWIWIGQLESLSVYHVNNYSEAKEYINGRIDLLFIDSAPAETRKELIEEYKNKANVIVVHDTEDSAEYVYGMAEVLSKFKYRKDFKPEGLPHTAIVSNNVDVSKW